MKHRATNLLAAVSFCLVLAVLALAGLLRGQDTYSFYENRDLAQRPALTGGGVLTGDWFADLDAWLTDQAPGRNTLLKLKTWLDMDVLRRPVVNEVVVEDDILLPWLDYGMFDLDAVPGDVERITANLAAVRDVTEASGGRFYYVAVPCQYAYFQDEYPWYLNNNADYTALSRELLSKSLAEAGVDYMDMGDLFASLGSPRELGSLVDNHYPMPGAYLVYRAILDRLRADTGLDIPVLEREDLTLNTLPNPYLGSRDRKLFGLWPGGEPLTWYSLPDIPFTRRDWGTDRDPYIYAFPGDDTVDATYTFYMGGDISETVIDTGREDLPSILIYGDSFTNAVECLLWTGFDEMRSLDLRHYTDMSLGDYIRAFRPQAVVCIRDYEALLSTDCNGRAPD